MQPKKNAVVNLCDKLTSSTNASCMYRLELVCMHVQMYLTMHASLQRVVIGLVAATCLDSRGG